MWETIKLFFIIASALFLFVVVVGTLIALLKFVFNDEEFIKNITAQTIGGIVAGLIGFLSAIGVYYLTQQREELNDRKDAFFQIHNEVSENRYSLMLELKREKPAPDRRKLLTEAWNQKKYLAPLRQDGKLIEGLKILYDKIDQYNFNTEFYKHLILWRSMTPDQIFNDTVKKIDREETQKLYEDIKLFERILTKESVLLGYRKKEDWPFNDCKFDDNFRIPYFIDENIVQKEK